MRLTLSVHGKCFVMLAALVCLLPVLLQAQTKDQGATEVPKGEPKVVFESLAHDFGTVQPNTGLTHSFVFKNSGSAPLLIEQVKAG